MIITIVVVIILAAVIIFTLSKNNIINNANMAMIASDIDVFKSELSLNLNNRLSDTLGSLDVDTINAKGDEIKDTFHQLKAKLYMEYYIHIF